MKLMNKANKILVAFLDAIASLQDRDECNASQMLFEHLDIIPHKKGHRCILNIKATLEVDRVTDAFLKHIG